MVIVQIRNVKKYEYIVINVFYKKKYSIIVISIKTYINNILVKKFKKNYKLFISTYINIYV